MENNKEQREQLIAQLQIAKHEARTLALTGTEQKNRAILAMAEQLWEQREFILAENEQDVRDASAHQSEARLDRLRLTEAKLKDMLEGLHQVAELPDPIGEQCETIQRPNGLNIEKVRVPMGVVAMIYESRPNVTVDAAALAIKTGNAVVLRGGKEAVRSNQALVSAMRAGLAREGINGDVIQFVTWTSHESVDVLVQARGLVDLAIPRGGGGLINRVVETARVPVIETGVGNCHVYVDGEADLQKALDIVVNAKVQRPSVCNAMETLLVHQSLAESWLPTCISKLTENGVQIRVCPVTEAVLRRRIPELSSIVSATEEDWGTEFLDLILAVKVVDSLDAAILHISKYGTRHSEAIVTENQDAASKFLKSVDAAVVYHNASTRFTDGFEFGFGAEIGISTQKLHARGPMGLRELTSYKFIAHGDGQVRQ